MTLKVSPRSLPVGDAQAIIDRAEPSALMILMGRINWWIPGWLDRVLPRINVEGAGYLPDASPAVEPEPVPAGTVHGPES